MRLVLLVASCATLTACAGSAPVAETLPPPRVVRPAPVPPAPVSAPVVVSVPEAPPAAPPVPRGTVDTRAYYESVDATEIVLANGVRVLFKPLPNGGKVLAGAILRVADPVAGRTSEPRMMLDEPTAALRVLLTNVRRVLAGEDGGASPQTIVLVGDATPEEVEVAAAWALVLDEAPPAAHYPDIDDPAYLVSAPPESDATFAVLVQWLKTHVPLQADDASTRRDEWAGTTALLGFSAGLPSIDGLPRPDVVALAEVRPTATEVEAARAEVARALPQSAAFWVEALADLHRTGSEFGPSRDPAFLASFTQRVMRVSAQDVTALAVRLAASPISIPR